MKIPPAIHLPALLGLLLLAAAIPASAQTWQTNPASGDWNTTGNWTPGGPPNSSTATAAFMTSATTSISLSADTEVNSIVFNPAASAFTITASPQFTLTVSGTGVTNNSGAAQNFVTASYGYANYGQINFNNSAAAGSNTFYTNNGGTVTDANYGMGGETIFNNSSNAGNGTFTNNAGALGSPTAYATGGETIFNDTSNAGNGTFIDEAGTAESALGGETSFNNSSSAGNGTFTNNGESVSDVDGAGNIYFNAGSTASSGTFTNNGGTIYGGAIYFSNSSAGNGTFTNNGGTGNGADGSSIQFTGTSTAGYASFTNNGGTVTGAAGASTNFTGVSAALAGVPSVSTPQPSSSAGNGTFTNNPGMAGGAGGGSTGFFQDTTASSGTFFNNGATVSAAEGGNTVFYETATAADGMFTNYGATVSGTGGGYTAFYNNSTADAATLTANGGSNGGQGGGIYFSDQSDGGTARIITNGNGFLDISGIGDGTSGGMNIGSIEGSGNVFLGANTLTLGGNDLSTTFSGAIQDGGASGGAGGSITKTGTGTLILGGFSSYTGATVINQGSLVVNGNIASSSGVTVSLGTRLGGSGSVSKISGAGSVAVGDPQILTATQVDPSGGLSFDFVFTQPGSPTYGNAAASGNDTLHLTGTTPFAFALSSSNTITVDFSGASLQAGQHYRGGFFTDASVPDSMLNAANFVYVGLNGADVDYTGLVTGSAGFASGTVDNGEVMDFAVVPEPSTWALVAGGLCAGLVLLGRTRRSPGRGASRLQT